MKWKSLRQSAALSLGALVVGGFVIITACVQQSPNIHPRVGGGWAAGVTKLYLPLTVSKPPSQPMVTSALSPPTGSGVTSSFPIGMFEDASMLGAAADFEKMIDDLRAHNLNSIMIINGSADGAQTYLNVSDRLNFDVYLSIAGDLDEKYWPDHIVVNDVSQARQILAPLINELKDHPSLKGYYIADEPELNRRTKLRLATQAVRELDPSRPVFPVLIGIDRIGPLFWDTQPSLMVLDVYPYGYANAACDTTMTGFGYGFLDMVGYLRIGALSKGASPLWTILQTHKFGSGGGFSLRQPSVPEIRLQNWLAIGEGATGMFWFIYSSQQGWIGLKDNPSLYMEVSDLARRISPFRSLLASLRRIASAKSANQIVVDDPKTFYASTLSNADGSKTYVVAVNKSCQDGSVALKANTFSGRLKDLETGQIYSFSTPIPFRAGDGKLFEVLKP